MDLGRLYESAFTDYNASGLDYGFNDEDATTLVSILDDIRRNAAA